MVFQSIATPSAELEYVSDCDGRFKRPWGRCKLLTCWAFEYFDHTLIGPLCKSGHKSGRADERVALLYDRNRDRYKLGLA